MSKVLIYHNPRWGKSRESVQILNDLNVEYEIVDYLNNPPSVDELQSLAIKMGINARDFIRTKEAAFKELNLQPRLDDDRFMFQKMSENPKLIERPIVIKGERAVLGRPPNKVEKFLSKDEIFKEYKWSTLIFKQIILIINENVLYGKCQLRLVF